MAVMQAWNYSSAQGGLSKHLQLVSNVPKPEASTLQPNQILVETHSVSLNPADYKVAGFPFLGKRIVPAIVGTDYSGRVAAVHSSNTTFRVGQAVFGRVDIFHFGRKKNGVLAQYLIAETEECAVIPEGLSLDEAATIGTAGVTAFDALRLGSHRDKNVFINGGSGGTGIFAIQLAKAMGAKVTTTCSTANVEMCKELGADEVIDYKTTNVLEKLKSGGQAFDYAIDNIGADLSLMKNCESFLKPKADYIQVGGNGNVLLKAHIIAVTPCLRPGKNPVTTVAIKQQASSLKRVGRYVDEGAVKIVFDSKYSFADTPKAFARLETGRTKGKIIVHVKNPDTTPVDEPSTTEVAVAAAEQANDEKAASVAVEPVTEKVAEEHVDATEPAVLAPVESAEEAKSVDDFRDVEEHEGAPMTRTETATAQPVKEKDAEHAA